MTGKAGWMTGAMLGAAALLPGGVGQAQTQPDYGYPRANERQAQNDPYAEDDGTGGEEQNTAPQQQNRAEEDFSDVTGAGEPQSELQPEEGRRPAPTPQPGRNIYGQDAYRGETEGEDAAMTDSCAIAARDEAERDGGYAEVRQMEAPRESRGGYSIDGDVEARSGWRAQDGRLRHFTCRIANGKIQDIYFQRDRAAR